jgi:hypothetical protein
LEPCQTLHVGRMTASAQGNGGVRKNDIEKAIKAPHAQGVTTGRYQRKGGTADRHRLEIY